MKKMFALIIFLCFSAVSLSAEAQVVDMRAFSRQRGYKAYRREKITLSPAVNTASAIQNRPEGEDAEKQKLPLSVQPSETVGKGNDTSGDQTEEFLKYIEENPHVKPDI